VVIELKSGEAPETAITQVLSYIGSLQDEDASCPVRGMLIARSFSTRVRLAARAAGVQLVEYGFSFSFRVVGADGGAVGSPAKRSSV
jgi:RecB family endonuclease NucS